MRRFNFCGKFINQQIYHADGRSIAPTIEIVQEETPCKINISIPTIITSKLNELPEFEPRYRIINAIRLNKPLSCNGLAFMALVDKNGKVYGKKIYKKSELNLKGGIKRGISIFNRKVVVDLNNKRLKLIGKDVVPEWISIDNLPPDGHKGKTHPFRGNKWKKVTPLTKSINNQ